MLHEFPFSLLDHGDIVIVKSHVVYTGLHAEVNCYTFKPSVRAQEALAHSSCMSYQHRDWEHNGAFWGGGHSGDGLGGRCSQGSETLTLFKAQFSDVPTLFKTEFRF